MFQNIYENIKVKEEILEDEGSSTIKTIINKLNLKNNIFLYIISIMMPILSLNKALLPFGIAWFCAVLAVGVPIGVIGGLVLVSSLIISGFIGGLTFVSEAIIVMLLILAFKRYTNTDRKEKKSLLFVIMISTFLTKMILGNIFNNFNIYDSLIYMLVSGILYKIFVNSIEFIREFKTKKAFAIEELVGVCLIATMLLTIFSNIQLFDISITNIMIALFIIVFGWKNSLKTSVIIAVIIGGVFVLVNKLDVSIMLIYILFGVLTGVLSRNRKGVVIAILLSTSVIMYLVTKNIYAVEFFIASLLLIFIPSTIKLNIDDILGNGNYLPTKNDRALNKTDENFESENVRIIKETKLEVKIESENKVVKEEVIEEFIFEKDFEKDFEKFIDDVLSGISEFEENIVYDEIMDLGNGFIESIYKVLESEEKLEKRHVLEILEGDNNYIVGAENENSKISKEIRLLVQKINDIYMLNNIKKEKKSLEKKEREKKNKHKKSK